MFADESLFEKKGSDIGSKTTYSRDVGNQETLFRTGYGTSVPRAPGTGTTVKQEVNIDEYLYNVEPDNQEQEQKSQINYRNSRRETGNEGNGLRNSRGRETSMDQQPDRPMGEMNRLPSAPRPGSASQNTRYKLLMQQKMNLLERQKTPYQEGPGGPDGPMGTGVTTNAMNATMSAFSKPPNVTLNPTGVAKPGNQPLSFPAFNIFTNPMPGANPVVFRKDDTNALNQLRPPPATVLLPPQEEKKKDEGRSSIDKSASTKKKQQQQEEQEKGDDNEEGWDIPTFPSNSDIVDMKAFAMNPAPKGYVLQCTIKREKGGLARFFPKYHIYFSDGLRFLLAGKKRPKNKTSNYAISASKSDCDKDSPYYIGKLRANFVGTEFLIYDHGENPEDTKDLSKVRREYGAIIYEQNILGERGPRKMKILIPDVTPSGNFKEFRPLSNKENMIQKFKDGRRDGMRFLFNKPPKWNEEVQAFVLNFHGRVDKPSVKNFQLIDTVNEDYIYMQFGRVGDDTFNMDIRWPMSLMQGFAIALSSFDFKLACE